MKPKKVLKYHSFLYGLGKLVVETNDGIRGYPGQFHKSGPIFVPYVPMVENPTTEEFRPIRSLMSRYAKKIVFGE
jgi:hypothetical protein